MDGAGERDAGVAQGRTRTGGSLGHVDPNKAMGPPAQPPGALSTSCRREAWAAGSEEAFNRGRGGERWEPGGAPGVELGGLNWTYSSHTVKDGGTHGRCGRPAPAHPPPRAPHPGTGPLGAPDCPEQIVRVRAAVEPLFPDRVPVSKRGRPPRLAAWPLGRPPGATGSSPRSPSRVPAGGPAWPHGASRLCLRKHANTRHGCSRCLAGFPTRRPLSPAHPQGRAAGGELLRKLLKVAQGRAGADRGRPGLAGARGTQSFPQEKRWLWGPGGHLLGV